eukprot:13141209-Heterocapsa_arctica.AAC.1
MFFARNRAEHFKLHAAIATVAAIATIADIAIIAAVAAIPADAAPCTIRGEEILLRDKTL